MAKKRKTLKQKQQTTVKRQKQLQGRETRQESSSGSSAFKYESLRTENRTQRKIKEEELLIVPSHYIRKDLTKTATLSVIFIGVIFVFYWIFNMGGKEILLSSIK